jgi:NOL1/NOP2/sun family putative RNA methylase
VASRAIPAPPRRGHEPLSEALAYLARYRDLIDDWPAFAEALRCPLAPCVWVNPDRIEAEALVALLAEEGRSARPFPGLPGALVLEDSLRPGQHWWYCAGLAHAQEAASQLPARLMDLAPGQRVLDLCAAPGGKTAQIAFALGNRGTLIANDFSVARIKALRGNLDRLGVLNVSTTSQDAVNWPGQAGQFDRILLDAPCSNEGTLRRDPELAGRLDLARSARLAVRQRDMLRRAVQCLRPLGRLVYSTCTLAPEENELVVRDVLREQDGRLRLVPVEVPGLVTAPGVTRWAGELLGDELARCVRLWPHHNDTGGFFVAVLEKEADARGEPEPAAAALTPETDPAWIANLAHHYGLPEASWAGLRAYRRTARGLHLVAADHTPAAAPPIDGSGILFLRTNIRSPMLTTAGAMLLAHRITANRIELDAAQREDYLARRAVWPRRVQGEGLRPGQVLVTHRGYGLGVGVYHRSGTLESLFPKRWSGCSSRGVRSPE